jgi:dipeptidyl aminopeptidase/acylaminoacyl peptidase
MTQIKLINAGVFLTSAKIRLISVICGLLFQSNKNMKRIILALFFALGLTLTVAAQSTFTVQELLKVRRVGDPQVSPDGRQVAFTIGDVNKEANRVVTQIYLVDVNGGEPKALTEGTSSNSIPRWSPDGKKIAYTTGGQIWTMDADGGNKKQVTKISTGAGNPVWSADGKMIAFVSDVYPECSGSDDCNKQKDEAAKNSKVKAVVTTRLLYRHWNEWRDKKRTHLFVVGSEGGTARLITDGDWDAPPYGASSWADYAFSPDSREIVYLRNPDKVEAISTNSDIFAVPVNGGNGRNITVSNRGYDVSPVYTRDGKYLLYRSQATPAFEADRWRLMRLDRATNQAVEIATRFDLQVEDFVVSPDGATVYFTALERGRGAVYSVPVAGGKPKLLMSDGFVSGLQITPDGQTLVFSYSTGQMPAEIARLRTDGGGMAQVTQINNRQMAQFALQELEDFEWTGAGGTKIHGFITKPANFDANKKYPLFVLIHGGPQSASNDSWGYRWNPQIWANAGYIVFSPNPRGSVGYGQQFVNEISGDWGGKVTVDIMNGVAALIQQKKYVDKERVGAGGASYGGYMVNWLLGRNNDPRVKFKVFLSHAGVYNLESMAGATEELWFTNWEFKGTPATNPEMYARWSPHKFAKNFNTPTLVTHGEQDFRVPIGEGLQLYTALQINNVDSKLIYFPDEGHWILKPQNSEFWYNNVLDWFNKYLKP